VRVGVLLARATSGESLLGAWNEVRDNAYADGDPGAPVIAFESRALKSLSELAEALADGTYQPSALTRVTIPKPTGGCRDLAIGTCASYCFPFQALCGLGFDRGGELV